MAAKQDPERPDSDRPQVQISGRDARQGDIILKSRRRRVVFLVGLLGIVLAAALLGILA